MAIATISDLRLPAKRRLPSFVFDYLDGGAGDEAGLTRNISAFDDILLKPRMLIDGELGLLIETDLLPVVPGQPLLVAWIEREPADGQLTETELPLPVTVPPPVAVHDQPASVEVQLLAEAL